MKPLEPLEFQSPIATITFSNGRTIDLRFNEVWQRRLMGFSQTVAQNIQSGSDEAVLLSLATEEPSLGAEVRTASDRSILSLLMPDLFRDFSPAIADLQKQLAMIETPRQWPTDDLQAYNAMMSREIPQALNTDSNVTFAGLTLTGLTPKSFLYSGVGGLLASTAAPTNGQLLIGSTGAVPVLAGLTGTAHQVIVTVGAGSITLTTPQNIDTTSSPTFAGITLNGLTTVSPGVGVEGIVVTEAENQWAIRIIGVATVGKSFGFQVSAGTNAADRPLSVRNAANSDLFVVDGAGSIFTLGTQGESFGPSAIATLTVTNGLITAHT